jgi:hypothetical protein
LDEEDIEAYRGDWVEAENSSDSSSDSSSESGEEDGVALTLVEPERDSLDKPEEPVTKKLKQAPSSLAFAHQTEIENFTPRLVDEQSLNMLLDALQRDNLKGTVEVLFGRSFSELDVECLNPNFEKTALVFAMQGSLWLDSLENSFLDHVGKNDPSKGYGLIGGKLSRLSRLALNQEKKKAPNKKANTNSLARLPSWKKTRNVAQEKRCLWMHAKLLHLYQSSCIDNDVKSVVRTRLPSGAKDDLLAATNEFLRIEGIQEFESTNKLKKKLETLVKDLVKMWGENDSKVEVLKEYKSVLSNKPAESKADVENLGNFLASYRGGINGGN